MSMYATEKKNQDTSAPCDILCMQLQKARHLHIYGSGRDGNHAWSSNDSKHDAWKCQSPLTDLPPSFCSRKLYANVDMNARCLLSAAPPCPPSMFS
mmetsp:Transcript_120066/g.188350  ORF Transcript_120066/g.188350 Transcript_120066/m.188350 type:complete len:96 (-) Transcript_120066:575-862(-)